MSIWSRRKRKRERQEKSATGGRGRPVCSRPKIGFPFHAASTHVQPCGEFRKLSVESERKSNRHHTRRGSLCAWAESHTIRKRYDCKWITSHPFWNIFASVIERKRFWKGLANKNKDWKLHSERNRDGARRAASLRPRSQRWHSSRKLGTGHGHQGTPQPVCHTHTLTRMCVFVP